MNNYLFVDAVSYLDADLLAEHLKNKERYRKKQQKRANNEETSYLAPPVVTSTNKAKKRRLWQKLGISAACFTIILSVSVWLFVPIKTGLQIEKTYIVNTENLCLQYREVSALSRFDVFTLESKIGDIYFEENGITYYTLKNYEGVDFLILLDATGEYKLLEFRECYSNEDDTEITLQYIFDSIYCINDVTQIKKITFEKVDHRQNGIIDKDVSIKKVSISEADLNQRILKILSSMKRTDNINVPSVLPYDEEYLKGEMALSSQTERKITIYLNDSRTLELDFIPYGNFVNFNGVVYVGISEPDYQWFIDVANIEMEHYNWGIPNDVEEGGLVTSPNDVEEDLVTP